MSKDKDYIPEIVLSPQAQAKIDSDPKLKEAFKGLSATMRQAMQSVKDGKYKTFDEALAVLGIEAEKITNWEGDELSWKAIFIERMSAHFKPETSTSDKFLAAASKLSETGWKESENGKNDPEKMADFFISEMKARKGPPK